MNLYVLPLVSIIFVLYVLGGGMEHFLAMWSQVLGLDLALLFLLVLGLDRLGLGLGLEHTVVENITDWRCCCLLMSGVVS